MRPLRGATLALTLGATAALSWACQPEEPERAATPASDDRGAGPGDLGADPASDGLGWKQGDCCVTADAADLPQDDTFACLKTFSGPLETATSGADGYQQLNKQSWTPLARFDARGTLWKMDLGKNHLKNCRAVQIGADWQGCPPDRFDYYADAKLPPKPGPAVCLAGGTFLGTQALTLSWSAVKASQSQAVTINSEQAIYDGLRLHNTHDPISPLVSKHFELRNCWISNSRDDAIENDAFASGVLEDNLVIDSFVFVSMRNTKPPNPPVAANGSGVLAIRNNIISLGTRDSAGKLFDGGGQFFKTSDKHAPDITLENNLFYMPKGLSRPDIDPSPAKVVSCSNNLVVYEGKKPVVPGPSGCFTFTTNTATYTQARQNWIDCHPGVAHLPGDPPADPSRCDPSFWGGGGN